MSTDRSVEEIAKSCIKFGVWEEELIDLPATEKAIAAALRAERERKVPPGHVLYEGVVRKVRSAGTNTDRPIYGTALMFGETAMVLEAAAEAAAKEVQGG